ncbi:hypothetical protein VU05_02180, partial [Desulfobulbus sp. F1]|nr:hypothetical protein [Desulfobulbus sp. F1]
MLPSSFLPSNRIENILLPVCLFFLFLLYFVFGAGWYEPTKLVLRGQASSGSSLIKVRWDSGAGFNDYEQRIVQSFLPPSTGSNIILGGTGRKNSSSYSKEVVCMAVLVDGKAVDLGLIAATGGLSPKGMLHFKDEEKISFTVQAASRISFKFRTDRPSGIAFVSINGSEVEYDLYMANEAQKFKQIDWWFLQPDGSFTVEVDMPRYPINDLEIMNGSASSEVQLSAVELHHGKGQVRNLLHGQTAKLGSLRLKHPLNGMRSFFHPLQCVQQMCFAALSVWLLMTLYRLYVTTGSLRGCFLAEKRYWFWFILGSSLAIFGTWLAAFWPGVMSVDSIAIWRAATLPDVYFNNNHPLLNLLYYKYLYHIWNNSALVHVIHVFMTALLFSWFGFWTYRQGVSIKIVLSWLIFVLCSIPVGVYTVMLWKDVPFALLVTFWAVMLAKLHQEKRHQGRLRWTRQQIIALFLLGVALPLIRHNGIIYIVVLPVLLILLRLVPLKNALFGLLLLLLVAGIGFTIIRNTQHTATAGSYREAAQPYVEMLTLKNIAKDAKRTMREYLTVLDVEAPQADKFHYYLQDRYAWWFLLHSGWWDVYPYHKEVVPFPRLRQKVMQLYEQSYQKTWIWLTWNPVWLLALLPLLTLCFRWLPNTAILGAMLLAGALPLVYLQLFNWRYYYFLYFGLLFLPAFISLDFSCRKQCASPQ